MVDATDLKSVSLYREWGFESLPGHHLFLLHDLFLSVFPQKLDF